jgi:hypothetical protein
MIPHFCGNPFHDIIHNAVVLMSMAPDWLPSIRAWAQLRLARRHQHSHAGH